MVLDSRNYDCASCVVSGELGCGPRARARDRKVAAQFEVSFDSSPHYQLRSDVLYDDDDFRRRRQIPRPQHRHNRFWAT